jgi:hypothetical protein
MAQHEIDDPCHYVAISGIDHLTEVSGGRWECWCINPCCNRPHALGGPPVCVCEFCSCVDPE